MRKQEKRGRRKGEGRQNEGEARNRKGKEPTVGDTRASRWKAVSLLSLLEAPIARGTANQQAHMLLFWKRRSCVINPLILFRGPFTSPSEYCSHCSHCSSVVDRLFLFRSVVFLLCSRTFHCRWIPDAHAIKYHMHIRPAYRITSQCLSPLKKASDILPKFHPTPAHATPALSHLGQKGMHKRDIQTPLAQIYMMYTCTTPSIVTYTMSTARPPGSDNW